MTNLTLVELNEGLQRAIENNKQSLINFYAYEIVCRIYVPFRSEKTFEEMLSDFGYKKIEKRVRK